MAATLDSRGMPRAHRRNGAETFKQVTVVGRYVNDSVLVILAS